MGILLLGASQVTGQQDEPQSPQGTYGSAFTYQGQLRDEGGTVNDTCDLQFTLWDAAAGGAQVGSTILLEDVLLEWGLFTARLDFGAAAFRGQARYLEVGVACPAGSGLVAMPRQELTGSPYALWALGAPWTGLQGVPADLADGDQDTTYSAGAGLLLEGTEFRVNRGEVQWRVSQTCAAGSSIRAIDVDGTVTCEADTDTTYTPGTGLSLVGGQFSVNFAGSGTAPTASRSDHNHPGAYWQLSGNAGTTPGTNYLGTSDNQALEIKVNGARALRLEPNTESPNVIGGYSGNWVADGVYGATIGGGGAADNGIGEPGQNGVTARFATVAGGVENTASGNGASVGGGWRNTASAPHSVVGGGWSNEATGGFATVAGGVGNLATDGYSAICGGAGDTASGYASFVGGGVANSSSGDYGFIGGGQNNQAQAAYTTIGGGGYNHTSDLYGTVGGGYGNQAGDAAGTADDRPYAAVCGGLNNAAQGSHAFVGGGRANSAVGEYATVGGGWGNWASFSRSTIGGGSDNTANSDGATVGGGIANTAGSVGATVGGGQANEAVEDFDAVGGGYYNFAGGPNAAIGGGYYNTAGGPYAAVGGGSGNSATDRNCTVGGGYNNQAGDNAGTEEDRPYAVVGGGRDNIASGPSSVVAGGGSNTASAIHSTVGGGLSNTASGERATVGGGYSNMAGDDSTTVSGGSSNTANADYATVGGGYNNLAIGANSTVGGGTGNSALVADSTVGGGNGNVVQTSGSGGTIGGGWHNFVNGNTATVPGGAENEATGGYSFAAGAQAHATHAGTFVWSSATATDSWGANTFTVRSHGGARFYSAAGTATGVQLGAGGTSWASISDRNAKEAFAPVDTGQLLEVLARMPVLTWNLKSQASEMRHIGPVAQDFNGSFAYLFGEVESPIHINNMDAVGISLAASQGLYELSQEQAAEIAGLQAENATLRDQLGGLEARLAALEAGQGAGGLATRLPFGWLLLGGGVIAVGAVVGRRARGGGR